MLTFFLRRLGVMALTMFCLTMVVFFLVNLEPNLKKLAIAQTFQRATEEQLESWLERNGYREPFLVRYGQWLGVWPKDPPVDEQGNPVQRFAFCDQPTERAFSGVIQGDFGCSTKFRTEVANKLFPALGATGADGTF